MNITVSQATSRLHWSAIGAGILSFIALYMLLGLIILFALAFLSEHVPSSSLYGSFKIVGLISWAIPGYIAARIAGQRGWLHGTLTGIGVGLLVALSLTFTFSWDSSMRDAVGAAMLKAFFIAWVLCTLSGAFVDLLAARNRRTHS